MGGPGSWPPISLDGRASWSEILVHCRIPDRSLQVQTVKLGGRRVAATFGHASDRLPQGGQPEARGCGSEDTGTAASPDSAPHPDVGRIGARRYSHGRSGARWVQHECGGGTGKALSLDGARPPPPRRGSTGPFCTELTPRLIKPQRRTVATSRSTLAMCRSARCSSRAARAARLTGAGWRRCTATAERQHKLCCCRCAAAARYSVRREPQKRRQ